MHTSNVKCLNSERLCSCVFTFVRSVLSGTFVRHVSGTFVRHVHVRTVCQACSHVSGVFVRNVYQECSRLSNVFMFAMSVSRACSRWSGMFVWHDYVCQVCLSATMKCVRYVCLARLSLSDLFTFVRRANVCQICSR